MMRISGRDDYEILILIGAVSEPTYLLSLFQPSTKLRILPWCHQSLTSNHEQDVRGFLFIDQR